MRRTKTELAVWGALALIGGLGAGWADLAAKDVEGPVALLMLAAFVLALPGRAPIALISIATAAGIPIMHVAHGNALNAGFILPLIPAFIGALGGHVAGLVLDSAASSLDVVPATNTGSWYRRPLSRRFILAVALVVIAAAGLPAVGFALSVLGHPARRWLALVWQIMTLLGWIGVAPLVLLVRRTIADEAIETNSRDIFVQLGVIAVLISVHALIIVALTAMLLIPVVPSFGAMSLAALGVYAPLDLLVYIAVATLGYMSDVDRRTRAAKQREDALRTESLESRLAALRARLNPHFLFNALNSVHVLATARKTDDTIRLVEGLTALLRYVLDDRRPTVVLSDELAFVREYLEVQRVRFGERLRFEVSCEPAAADALIPQLLLQPLVENAVEHGVARTLDGGTVRVHASLSSDTLHVTVDNDGAADAQTEPASGIGLANTRERLTRLYGMRASLALDRRQNGETHVRVALPLERAAA